MKDLKETSTCGNQLEIKSQADFFRLDNIESYLTDEEKDDYADSITLVETVNFELCCSEGA